MNKVIVWYVFFLLVVSCVWAENIEVIDLDTALQTALAENFQLNQARRDSEIAYWNQRIAFSAYLPQVSSVFSAQKYHNYPALNYDKNYQLDLILRQSLIDFSQIADIKSAYAATNHFKHIQRSFEQAVMFDTISHFYRCLLDQQQLEIRKEALVLAEEELGVARLRYQEGMVSYYDLLRSETKYLSASAQLRTAEADYRKSLNEFKNILGFKPDKEIKIRGKLDFTFKDFLFQDLLEKINTLHPSVIALDYLIKERQESVSSFRAEFLPRLDLEAVRSAAKYHQTLDEQWDDNWRAYLRVSLPLFEGTRRYSQLKRSQQELEKAKIQKKELTNEIKKDIDSFYQDYLSAQELVASQKKNFKKSQELYQLVRKRYKVGEASEIELLDAHLNLIDVESAYKKAQYQAIVSYYGMFLAAGQLDIAEIAGHNQAPE